MGSKRNRRRVRQAAVAQDRSTGGQWAFILTVVAAAIAIGILIMFGVSRLNQPDASEDDEVHDPEEAGEHRGDDTDEGQLEYIDSR